jgi:N-acetylmuramoyl-L-alanine amidase
MPPVPQTRVAAMSAALVGMLAAGPNAAQQIGGAAPTPNARPTATVRSITRTPLPRGDRITIELSREVSYTADRVPDPDRLFFDVADAVVPGAMSMRAQALTGTWISGVRVGQHTQTAIRIVLQLTGSPRHSVFALYTPYRLVIDLEREPGGEAPSAVRSASGPVADISARAAAVAPIVPAPAPSPSPAPPLSAPAPETAPERIPTLTVPAAPVDLPLSLRSAHPITLAIPAPPGGTARGDYSLSRQLGLGLSRIVIDPGHGGHDPGAQANGIDEANLVLDVALRLEALLKAQSTFDIVMTRRTDEFIPLEERTAIANREGADLFLSIHANAARDTLVGGVETYFLNFATNPTAEAVAARENATSPKTMGSLPDLVKSITLNNKIEESREFATFVQASMVQDLKAPQRTVRDLGVKQAPFVVLIGAGMPSVLAEISFVTNRSEAALLKQPAYRQTIAQALFDAVVRYRDSLKRLAPAPGKDGAIH